MASANNNSVDVVVVGAGLAGTVAAAVLGRNARVILVDPRPSCPQVFKAEKIDQVQVCLFRKFGLIDYLLPYSGRIDQVRVAYEGRIFRVVPIEQYGISYPHMVNAVREHLPASVEFRLGRVEAIANSDDVQRIRLAGGEEIRSRLVVLASGVSQNLLGNLRLRRRVIQKDQCVVLGFTIVPAAVAEFDFDSITYYSLSPALRIDYLTLFRFPHGMRANLFVFRRAADPWVREFIQQPEYMLHQHLPKVQAVTGSFRVTGKIESGRVDLYQVEGNPQPGVVLIGDAFQTACPSTGMGMAKILNDVDVLSDYVPGWLSSPGMTKEKISNYYDDPRKRALDSRAIHRAHFLRCAATDTSKGWRIYRFLRQVKLRWLSAVASYRMKPRETPKPGAFNPATLK